MIDVVFLLLIFFMVTTSFTQAEKELDPAIKTDGSGTNTASDLEPIIIDVFDDGGIPSFRLGSQTSTTIDELRIQLQAITNRDDGAFVKVGNGVPFYYPAAAMQVCSELSFATVTYIASEN
tara:strand:- start:351 stop:713 length:363 start_codon:yes stop_codon:yes gene_type:complete